MKPIINVFIIFMMIFPFFAQSQDVQPKNQVISAKRSGKTFEDVSVFRLNTSKSGTPVPKEFKNYSILSLQPTSMKTLASRAPEAMSFSLPGKKSSMLLELVKVDITSDDFIIKEMPSGKIIKPNPNIAHYRGIVKNSPNSIAAISIQNGEISGIISLDDEVGNLVLAKLDNSKDHIVYEDKDISHLNDFVCQTNATHDKSNPEEKSENDNPSANRTKCPEIFFDIGNDIVRNRGGAQAASTYIQAIFNQVAILYNNEDVNIKISGIRAWTSTTPFSGLDGFRSYRNRNGFNGDLAHFVTYNYSGGVAWLNGLCGSYRYGLSGINRSYSNVPRYSWTVNVIAHELGHNFGSNHTHSCAWNGNNTAIDGCYNTEGGCRRPGIPSNGGTIMSYCHLTNTGINLRKGFGSQPGDVIRRTIARANCVGVCDDNGGGGDGGDEEVDCTGIDEWSGNVNYRPGDKVTYRGRLFERTTNNDWKTLGQCRDTDPCSRAVQWTPNTTYSPGDVVIYQGNTWLRTANNDWEFLDCGSNTIDPCATVDPWAEGINYQTGDQVVYEGKVFEWNGTEWIELATCLDNPSALRQPGTAIISVIDSNIRLYPNPASNYLNIEVINPKSEILDIVIKDMNGRVFQTILPEKKPGDLIIKQRVAVDQLAAGIYFIQLKINSKTLTKKFFVE